MEEVATCMSAVLGNLEWSIPHFIADFGGTRPHHTMSICIPVSVCPVAIFLTEKANLCSQFNWLAKPPYSQ